jgi:hypothetical protein
MSVYKGTTYSNLTAINATIDSLTAGVSAVGPLTLATYAVAGVPAAADNTGALIYVSNGATGNPVVAFSDGTNWLRVDTKAAIAAS